MKIAVTMGLSGNDCRPTIYAVAHLDLPPYIVGFPHYPTAPRNGIQPFIIAYGNGLDAPSAPSLYRTAAVRQGAQPRE